MASIQSRKAEHVLVTPKSALPQLGARLGFLLVLVALMIGQFASAARAGGVRATVSIERLDFIDGAQTLDPFQFFFNEKPDYFAKVRLLALDGTILRDCGETPFMKNLQHAVYSPAAVLCAGRSALTEPFFVEVEARDADWDLENAQAVHNPADLADITPDPNGKVWRSPPFMCSSSCSPLHIDTSGDNTRARFTITTVTEPNGFVGTPVAFPPSIDPSLGEHTTISGTLISPGSITITAEPDPPTNGQRQIIVDHAVISDPSRVFHIDWSGKVSVGAPLAMEPGTYKLVVSINGEAASSPVFVTIVRHDPHQLVLGSILPGDNNSPFGRPFSFGLTTTANANVRLEIRGPSATLDPNCDRFHALQLPLIRHIEQALVAGQHDVTWDGLSDSGSRADPGGYCAIADATDQASGTPLQVAGSWPPIRVVEAEKIKLFVRTEPAVPSLEPRKPVRIIATVFAVNGATGGGNPTFANQIVISAGGAASGAFPAPSDKVSCQFASTCTLVVDRALLTLPGASAPSGTLAYAARASLAGQVGSLDTGVRLTDIDPPSPGSLLRVFRASVAAVPAASAGNVRQANFENAFDLVFYPGTGYDLAVPAGRSRFDELVGENIDALFGFSTTSRHESSAFDHLSAVSVWASSTSQDVSPTPGANTVNSNFCNLGTHDPVSFANANGVLHAVNCRDSAPGNFFTSMMTDLSRLDTTWHELHHVAYGLSDEYGPDGAYWLADPFPNAYPDLQSCARLGSVPAQCANINPPNAQWSVSDVAAGDVMARGATEHADDLRRSDFFYLGCARGRC